MKPLRLGQAALYQGDALALIPRLRLADAVVTDPPYASGGRTLTEKRVPTAEKYTAKKKGQRVASAYPSFEGDALDQRSWIIWTQMWLRLARERANDGAYLLVFVDWRQIAALTDAVQMSGWTWRGILAWDKSTEARIAHTGYFRQQCEFIVWGTNGKCAQRPDLGAGRTLSGCFQHGRAKGADRMHQTAKPTALVRDLLRCVRPGGHVIDPFMGSAPIGAAALEMGLSYDGIELGKDIFPSAVRRLKAIANE